jgi:hypothetical protein
MSESPSPSIEQDPPTAASVPADVAAEPAAAGGERAADLDPTRYGDWEKNGRCIDF